VILRRAFLAMPFAVWAIGEMVLRPRDGSGARQTGPAEQVEIVKFSDLGVRLGLVRVSKVVRSNSGWRKMLSVEQYYVTRQQGTDTAFSGTYYQLHSPGIFRCVCCDDALFSSDTKFDSGTGWPSFTAPMAPENIGTRTDRSLPIEERTEVHCTLCDAHLGHLFKDGPEPTFQRYCINESALRFIARA
jgi:peptide-methionine (R)-S-oxide reductase